MTARWDSEWDDEEWLKQQSITTLREVYASEPPAGVDKSAIKGKIKELMTTRLQENAAAGFKNEAENNAYDLLSYVKVVDEDALQAEVTDAGGNKHKVKDVVYDVVDSRIRALDGKDDLVSYLQRKALLETAKTIQKDDADKVRVFDEAIKEEREKIEYELSQPREEISDNEFAHYDEADRSGALDDVSDAAKNAFIDRLAQLSGWSNIEGKVITENDSRLAQSINSLDVYDNDGKLTDIYSECAELADKIQFDVPDGTDAKEIQGYKQQLLANAAMRATNEVLKDRSFVFRHKTAEDIMNAYKAEIGRQFERSVVLAGLASNGVGQLLLEDVKINRKNGEITYEGKDEAIRDKFAAAVNGKLPIHPDVLWLDTKNLDTENKKISKILKRKHVDENKLSFRQKAQQVMKGAWNNIIKEGGWRKLAANSVIYGGAALATGIGLTGLGAGLYAGWTAVNAWVMPAYDKLHKEMNEKGIKGWKNRVPYFCKNFIRGWKEARKEPGFWTHSIIRTIEGVAVGGITGGVLTVGGTGVSWARRGVMFAGKGITNLATRVQLHYARKALSKNYSVENARRVQALETRLRGDNTAVLGVTAGSVAADIFGGADVTENASQTLNDVHQPINFDENGNGIADALERSAVTMPDENGNGIPDYLERQEEPDSGSTLEDTTVPGDAPAAAADETPAGETPVENGNENAATGDASNTENGAGTEGTTDKGDNAGNDGASESEVPPAAPQPGDVLSRQELGDGVVKTVTMGTKYNFIQYEGIPEGTIQTPDDFQSFLEHRIHNMNQYNKLVNVVDGAGNNVPLEQATDIMLKRLSEGRLDIPEGMTPEHALYIAYMKAHYFGDKSLLQTIACPESAETNAIHNQLALDSRLFNNHNIRGVGYGVPTNGMKLIDNSGTVDARICTPSPEHTSVLETRSQDSELLKPLQEIIAEAETNPDTRQVITLNFKDPYSEATATYASGKDNFAVEQTTADGSVKYMGMEKDGTLHLYQNNVDLNADRRLGTSGIQVEHHIPLSLNMNNLGAAKITDLENVTTYQYGEGKNALVFSIDKESGIVTTTIGKQEVILDQKTAQAALANIQKAAEEGGVDKVYNYKSGDEAEQISAVAEYADKDRKTRVEEALNDKVEKAVEKASRDKTEVTYEDRQAAVAAKIAEIKARQAAVTDNTAAGETAGSSNNGIEPETKTAATTTEQEGVEAQSQSAATTEQEGTETLSQSVGAEKGTPDAAAAVSENQPAGNNNNTWVPKGYDYGVGSLHYYINEDGGLNVDIKVNAESYNISEADINEVHEACCRAKGTAVDDAGDKLWHKKLLDEYLVAQHIQHIQEQGGEVANGDKFLEQFDKKLKDNGLEIGKDGKLHATEENLKKPLYTEKQLRQNYAARQQQLYNNFRNNSR